MICAAGSINREYWRLTPEASTDDDSLILVQGRRRTTEGYWPGMRLSEDGIQRFGQSISDVCRIVDDFFTSPKVQPTMRFPYSELMAVCDSQMYTIELAISISGTGLKSICTTVFGKDVECRPCLYLVDEEPFQFSGDLDDFVSSLTGCRTPPPSLDYHVVDDVT